VKGTSSAGIPNGWQKTTVGDLFKVCGGGTPSTKVAEFWSGTIPWITSADIDEDHHISSRRRITRAAIASSATNLVPEGSAIVATRVSLGKVGLASEPICFSQDCQALIFDPDCFDSRYVVLHMSWVASEFRHIGRGTTINGITKKQLLDASFLLPPVEEQGRIVGEIEKQYTRLDAAVEALKRVKANLKRYRASVLKAACEGRLVPTEAELAQREGRSYEPASELLKRILAERRARWEADQLAKFSAAGKEPKDDKWKAKYKEPLAPNTANLPKLPEGWTWVSLEQLSWTASYGTSEKCDYEFTGAPVLRIPNIEGGRIDLSDLKFASTKSALDESDALCPGDLLVIRTNGSRNLIGRGALVRSKFDRAHFYASYLIRFRLTLATGAAL
jgi:type I restriction enzyme, S subunit